MKISAIINPRFMKLCNNIVVSSHKRQFVNGRSGVVTIEYLILGTFLALALLVGVQVVRETSAHTQSRQHLQNMAAVLLDEFQKEGRFPDSIPEHWKVRDGYRYELVRRTESEIEVLARPGVPGLTGLEELRLVAGSDGNARIEFQLAEGAIEARRKMFAELGRAAAGSTKSLLVLASKNVRANLEELLRTGDFRSVSRFGSVPELISRMDRDRDGLLTLAEVFDGGSIPDANSRGVASDPSAEILREFLGRAREIMAIGHWGEDADALPGLVVDHIQEPFDAVLSHTFIQRVLPHLTADSLTPTTTPPAPRRRGP